MNTPTYTARKIGDHYELERQDTRRRQEISPWPALVGGGLLLLGLGRRGLSGAVLSAVGGGILYCAWTQGSEARGARPSHGKRLSTAAGPTNQHGAGRTRQFPVDEVEEASMESFPASDSPAWTTTGAR